MARRKTIGQFPIVSIAANPPLPLQIRTLNPHSQQNVSYWAQELWEYQVSLILHQISEFQAYGYRDAHRLKINRNFVAIERKKSTFRAVEDGLSYNEEVSDGEKSCWAPWPPRCRRLVRISRSIPDWCRRIHQKRIHTTQAEDRRASLSFVRVRPTIYMQPRFLHMAWAAQPADYKCRVSTHTSPLHAHHR